MKNPDLHLAHFIEHEAKKLRSIPDVISLMQKLQEKLAEVDGLRWFNLLYLRVTEAINEENWADFEWMEALDVEFAKLYFQGIGACLKKNPQAPLAWRVLMDRRFHKLKKVQYALAGINAHINRDLMLAVAKAYERTRRNPSREEYKEYTAVNTILERTEVRMVQQLATGWVKVFCSILKPLDRIFIMFLIRHWRETAWKNGVRSWTFKDKPHALRGLIRTRDKIAYKRGRILLSAWW